MLSNILKSDNLYDKVKEDLKFKISKLKKIPKIAIIRFGNSPADLAYQKGIIATSSSLGITDDVYEFDINIDTYTILSLLERLNNDDDIGGILILKPMPKSLDEEKINHKISVDKDLDCINPVNKAKVYSGDIDGFIPLSPKAAVKLLEYYDYDLKGKKCVIVNDSQIVGKPLAMILLKKMATVSICHIYTQDLKAYTKNADIVFVATGVPEMFDSSYFSENTTVIDIGISRNKKGEMKGDLDEEEVNGKIKAYSPVKGGVGKLTNLFLLESMINKALKNK